MDKVLCVCTGNISRSPMMQAVLQQDLGDEFLVESAGVSQALAGRPANHRSVACMRERGVDLSGHVSRWIGDLDLSQYGWIVCVGHEEADKVWSALGADAACVIVANEDEGGIPDPYELGLGGYRDCLVLLDQVMPQIARRIREAGLGSAPITERSPFRLLRRGNATRYRLCFGLRQESESRLAPSPIDPHIE